ncbi:hypothetical protein CP967_04345 [Streptomyces nitrosporeus]|uniref:Uncharacterized protein n=1 Tax=Streptomyces nitrosporeus TaxID=28894 RepID=A0A5J6F5K2_9ACTN|nr:hypothetical protein [Streptomyces nitrosporeus]QEU71287.1 hypothetical protein CP967_04345 [Streptomyces nitrosporeus]GGY99100.1 hypothetical protein GCM10010327_32150 [Streptomyces nitrosporeus]
MDLVHLSDILLSHLTDLVPYLQFVAAAGGAAATVRRAARAGRRRLNARRAPDTEASRTTAAD